MTQIKTPEEIVEELWDKHSTLIGTQISDLDYYAGRNVITEQDFKKAITPLQSRIAELEAENEKLKKMYEAGEKLLSCIPLNNGNVYLVGFDEALNEWRKI